MSTMEAQDQIILSASSISTYLTCPLRWQFAYVQGVKSPPSLRMGIGLAGHRAVEVNMRQKVDSRQDLPTGDVLDAFSTEFDALASEGMALDGDEDLGTGKDSGVAAVEKYHLSAAPMIQPIAVEQPIQFSLGGIVYSGQIDLVDDDEVIRDTKFVGRVPAEGKYDLNMIGYGVGYQVDTGRQATDTVLDVIVRTKVPKYVKVEAGGPVTDDQISRLAFVAEGVAEGIRKGNFPATGLENRGACSYCGYRAMCPARKGAR